MFTKTLIVAFALLSMVQAALGQTAPATSPQEPAPSAADIAFEPLRKDMANLLRSLQNKGGIAPDDHLIIGRVRDRAAAYSREHPEDVRGLAVELTLAGWLGEDELVDDLYRRILEIKPDDEKIRLGYVSRLRDQNRFAEALEVLGSSEIDPVASPEAVVLKSDLLFATNQIAESVEALDTIPADVLQNNALVQFQVKQARELRAPYVALWEQEQSIREREQAADDLPRAQLNTDKGQIIVELFEDQASNTVANFIDLAEKGFYDGTTFHNVIPGDRVVGGDPNSKQDATGTSGQGDAGYALPDEHQRLDHRSHFVGSIGMVKTAAPNSASSQFYITVTPQPELNSTNTVFGRVIEGMDVVRRLEKDDRVASIEIIRKREHDYVPATMPLPGANLTTQPLQLGSPQSVPSTAPANPILNPLPPPVDPSTQPEG